MQGTRDCHGARIRSAGSGGGVPGRECMQCGGLWGTRLDAHVSLGARLGGAVLVVSPRGMRRRGSVRSSPSSRFRLKKWPYGPPPGNHTVQPCLQGVADQSPRCYSLCTDVTLGRKFSFVVLYSDKVCNFKSRNASQHGHGHASCSHGYGNVVT